MAKDKTNYNIPVELKAVFEAARRTDGRLDTATEFVVQAMTAYVMQMRRGERLVYPLEFVSDKSSDKIQGDAKRNPR